MIAQLRTKVDEATIEVVVGDMATARAPGEYSLVYLVFNTISNLLTQAEQVDCIRNAARHLIPGRRFVIELWVPELRTLPPGQQATVWLAESGYIALDTYDVLQQHVVSHHFRFGEGKQAQSMTMSWQLERGSPRRGVADSAASPRSPRGSGLRRPARSRPAGGWRRAPGAFGQPARPASIENVVEVTMALASEAR